MGVCGSSASKKSKDVKEPLQIVDLPAKFGNAGQEIADFTELAARYRTELVKAQESSPEKKVYARLFNFYYSWKYCQSTAHENLRYSDLLVYEEFVKEVIATSDLQASMKKAERLRHALYLECNLRHLMLLYPSDLLEQDLSLIFLDFFRPQLDASTVLVSFGVSLVHFAARAVDSEKHRAALRDHLDAECALLVEDDAAARQDYWRLWDAFLQSTPVKDLSKIVTSRGVNPVERISIAIGKPDFSSVTTSLDFDKSMEAGYKAIKGVKSIPADLESLLTSFAASLARMYSTLDSNARISEKSKAKAVFEYQVLKIRYKKANLGADLQRELMKFESYLADSLVNQKGGVQPPGDDFHNRYLNYLQHDLTVYGVFDHLLPFKVRSELCRWTKSDSGTEVTQDKEKDERLDKDQCKSTLDMLSSLGEIRAYWKAHPEQRKLTQEGLAGVFTDINSSVSFLEIDKGSEYKQLVGANYFLDFEQIHGDFDFELLRKALSTGQVNARYQDLMGPQEVFDVNLDDINVFSIDGHSVPKRNASKQSTLLNYLLMTLPAYLKDDVSVLKDHAEKHAAMRRCTEFTTKDLQKIEVSSKRLQDCKNKAVGACSDCTTLLDPNPEKVRKIDWKAVNEAFERLQSVAQDLDDTKADKQAVLLQTAIKSAMDTHIQVSLMPISILAIKLSYLSSEKLQRCLEKLETSFKQGNTEIQRSTVGDLTAMIEDIRKGLVDVHDLCTNLDFRSVVMFEVDIAISEVLEGLDPFFANLAAICKLDGLKKSRDSDKTQFLAKVAQLEELSDKVRPLLLS